MKYRTIVFISLLTACGCPLQATSTARPEVLTCTQTGRPGPGIGDAFRGKLRNEDYDFSAYIPLGLTGWTGTGESAPFHGFTIFLDRQQQSCIVFEVHIRVDRQSAPRRPAGATAIELGKATGWQTTTSGEGLGLVNVITVFSFRRPHEVEDGSVLLVAPSARSENALRIYKAFLQRLRFGAY